LTGFKENGLTADEGRKVANYDSAHASRSWLKTLQSGGVVVVVEFDAELRAAENLRGVEPEPQKVFTSF
jgi:hypothetical protein